MRKCEKKLLHGEITWVGRGERQRDKEKDKYIIVLCVHSHSKLERPMLMYGEKEIRALEA